MPIPLFENISRISQTNRNSHTNNEDLVTHHKGVQDFDHSPALGMYIVTKNELYEDHTIPENSTPSPTGQNRDG